MGKGIATRIVVLLSSVAVAIAACGGSPRAVTTYETWQYTVSIPNDLAVTPLNQDPTYVWAHPEISFATSTAAIQLGFQVRPTRQCDAGTMLVLAQQLERGVSIGSGSEPVQMTFGSAPGAAYTRTATGVDLAVAVSCSGPSSVIALASGLKIADLQAVMATFRFRDPPGDPAHPPAAGTAAPAPSA